LLMLIFQIVADTAHFKTRDLATTINYPRLC
jgi:hypothetical protein